MFECKVLVTGGSGLLGRQIMSVLSGAGVSCHGLCFSRPGEQLTSLDLTDFPASKKFIVDYKPSHVIHTAAQRFPDKVEADYEAALRINVESSRNIAEACKEVGARMIYISTDYVFDGSHPPYFPDNEPHPLNKYGDSKLGGEKAVLAVDDKFLVLRIPVLYGGVTKLNESAVTVLLDVVRNGKPCSVSSYEVRCPSHTRDIARILLELIIKNPPGGVYHWCGLEKLSKWDMCRIIGEELGLDTSHLQEVTGAGGTPRPRDVELDRTRLKQLGIEFHTKFKDGLMEDLKQFL